MMAEVFITLGIVTGLFLVLIAGIALVIIHAQAEARAKMKKEGLREFDIQVARITAALDLVPRTTTALPNILFDKGDYDDFMDRFEKFAKDEAVFLENLGSDGYLKDAMSDARFFIEKMFEKGDF